MEEIYVYAPQVIAGKMKAIKSAMVFLSLLMKFADEMNRIEINKGEFASQMKVDKKTITNWVNKLRDNGVIKYKYSGSTRLNPFFYYSGTRENYEKAIAEWRSFVSDNVAAKKRLNVK